MCPFWAFFFFPGKLWFQIRTEEMDLIAQRGIAAHYCGRVFADGLNGQVIPRNSRGKPACLNNSNAALRVTWRSFFFFNKIISPFKFIIFPNPPLQNLLLYRWSPFDFFQIGWLNAIREWQEEFVGNMTSREFVDVITRDLLGSRVFVFTPRGEVKGDKYIYQSVDLYTTKSMIAQLYLIASCSWTDKKFAKGSYSCWLCIYDSHRDWKQDGGCEGILYRCQINFLVLLVFLFRWLLYLRWMVTLFLQHMYSPMLKLWRL